MNLVDILTINYSPGSKEEVTELVYRALDFFPSKAWEVAVYRGIATIPYDMKLRIGEATHDGFIYKNLLRQLREIKKRSENWLLGITLNPVIIAEYAFKDGKLKRNIWLVHDFGAADVGFASLFHLKEGTLEKLLAHTFGHASNLSHHLQPIDLMYPELKELEKVSSFCRGCKEKLASYG